MKYKVNIEELTHDDLVNLFSTATYGNHANMQIVYGEYDKSNKRIAEQDCYEDKLAEILLSGGTIIVMDYCGAEYDAEDLGYYGYEGKNWKRKFFDVEEGYHGACYVPCYEITLETLMNGMSNEEAAPYIQQLFIEEEGDLYTAWNIMQIAVFGEVVYG